MNFKVFLEPRLDGEDKVYYLAKLKGPFTLNFKQGAAFLIFLSEEGEEELQIASVDEYLNYNKYHKRSDRVKVELATRKDSEGKSFLVGKIKLKATLDCSQGISFLVFTSRVGQEELQIVGNFEFEKSGIKPEDKRGKKIQELIEKTESTPEAILSISSPLPQLKEDFISENKESSFDDFGAETKEPVHDSL